MSLGWLELLTVCVCAVKGNGRRGKRDFTCSTSDSWGEIYCMMDSWWMVVWRTFGPVHLATYYRVHVACLTMRFTVRHVSVSCFTSTAILQMYHKGVTRGAQSRGEYCMTGEKEEEDDFQSHHSKPFTSEPHCWLCHHPVYIPVPDWMCCSSGENISAPRRLPQCLITPHPWLQQCVFPPSDCICEEKNKVGWTLLSLTIVFLFLQWKCF